MLVNIKVMGYDSDNYKRQEIKDLYHVLYNNRIKEGMSPQQAKRYAMDMSSLRFGISNDRVRHILYDKENNPGYRSFIYQNNLSIISSLEELIRTYQETLRTYENTIKEMGEDEGKELIQAKAISVRAKIKRYQKLVNGIKEVNDFYTGTKG